MYDFEGRREYYERLSDVELHFAVRDVNEARGAVEEIARTGDPAAEEKALFYCDEINTICQIMIERRPKRERLVVK